MKTIATITAIFLTLCTYSQKLEEIIYGPRTKNGKIFFNNKLEFDFLEKEKSAYNYLPDESIISLKNLKSKSGERKYYIYIQAFNPLHYSTQFSSKLITDSLNFKAKKAISEFIELAASFSKSVTLSTIQTSIKDENQSISMRCLKQATNLINLNFKNKESTEVKINEVRHEFNQLKLDFSELKTNVSTAENELETKSSTMKIFSFSQIEQTALAARNQINEESRLLKMLGTLLTTIDLFMKDLKEDSNDDGWFYKLEFGTLTNDKMAEITIQLIEHKVEVIGDQVIQKDNHVIAKKHFFIRSYSLFIPEVSAGFCYADHNYSNFITAQNNAGENIIARGADQIMNKFSLSTMMNFNFNIRNSPILPFLQVGGGISEKVPIGLIGVGLRFGSYEFKNIAISTGASFTGIQQLSTLNIGNVVKDDLEIQNDLKYKLSAPKLYLGIQYNF